MPCLKAVLFVSVHQYIPRVGLAWEHEDDPALYLASFTDTRTFTHLQGWLRLSTDADTTTNVCLVCASAAVKRRVAEALDKFARVNLETRSPKDIITLEEDVSKNMALQATKLLDKLSQQARLLFQAVCLDSDSRPRDFKLVCCINDRITTVPHHVLVDLNIIPKGANSKSFIDSPTIEGFINTKIRTPMGRSRLRGFLTHVLVSVEEIKMRQWLFKKFLDDRQFRLQCHGCCMNRVCNLDQICDQLVTAHKLSGKGRKHLVRSLPALVDSITALSTMVSVLSTGFPQSESIEMGDGSEMTLPEQTRECGTTLFSREYLDPLKEDVRRLMRLRDLIVKVFDIEAVRASRYDPDVLLLNASLVPSVQEAKTGIDECLDAIEKHKAAVERKLECPKKLRIIPDSKEGRIFRVPRSVDIPREYQLIRINKAETLFITSKLQKLNAELHEHREKVESTETMFVDKTLTVAATYEQPLRVVADIVGLLDIVAAAASALGLVSAAGQAKWRLPIYSEPELPLIDVRELCHPLLELQNEVQGGSQSKVTPNSVMLGGQSQRKLVLVTGPNMGGKSTFARQTAMACYLGQLGVSVPAREAMLTPFKIIWTRIGADDRPSQGISTFFAEALETALMLNTLGAIPKLQKGQPPAALVLIDELGRGTSALDGYAFAKAVMDDLTESNPLCLSIFATHFHELGFTENKHVHPMKLVKKNETLGKFAVTYTAEDGVEKDSDGIRLAEKFGFPPEIINEALRVIKH